MTTSRTGPTAPLSTTLLLPGLLAGYPRIPPAGRVVAGRYRLRRLLGRGGMGAVWLATDQALHRPVAVKQPLLSGLVTDVERRAARARLRREARLAARVDHTGTVRVYDLAEETGDPWIVMEALPGRTLQAVLRDDGPLPVSQVTSLGLGLLEALEATHRAGIVHRDVKPGNVQLCGGQRVVLTDFGIASTIEGGAGASTGGIVGSPGYVAPEQIHGGRVEPASDLFSLGATLYAAVEGRSPFGKGRAAAILDAVATDPPAPLLRAGPIGPVIEGLLAKDPARRLGPDQARAALQAITGNHISIVNWCKGASLAVGGRGSPEDAMTAAAMAPAAFRRVRDLVLPARQVEVVEQDVLAQILALNLSIAELEQAGGALRGPGPHGLANTTRTTWRIEPVHRLA